MVLKPLRLILWDDQFTSISYPEIKFELLRLMILLMMTITQIMNTY